jgi:hypothetical protein
MKKTVLLLACLHLLTLCVSAQLQNQNSQVVASIGAPAGNYIYLLQGDNLPAYSAAETDHFIISRASYDPTASQSPVSAASKIGEYGPVGTVKEMKRIFTSEQVADLRKLYKQSSDAEMAAFFKRHAEPADYGPGYGLIEIRRAMGEVFLDKDVKDSQVYVYTIERVTRAGISQPWGHTVVQAHSGDCRLPNFQPALSDTRIFDSSITYIWRMPIRRDVPCVRPAGSLIPGLRLPALEPGTIRANIYVEKGGQFVRAQKTAATLTASGDTVQFSYTERVVPDQAFTAYMQTEDETYNTGLYSDTVTSYAVSQRHVPLILKLIVTDIENGVIVSWDKLPPKPYISGILVTRFDNNDHLDTLAMLQPGDFNFIDLKMTVGVHYRYQVSAVFSQQNVVQKVPATAVATVTLFSRPLPPFNLVVKPEGIHLRLNWESVSQKSIYGYYVFRGTAPGKISLVAGPIFEKTFLDTAHSLSGRSAYYYSVMSRNLRQDSSEHSPVAHAIPNRTVETEQVTMIRFFRLNNNIRVEWNDVRRRDNVIVSFLVQRRASGEAIFTTITPEPLSVDFFLDSNVVAGVSYQYRIACVNIKGEAGPYGEVSEFMLTKKDVAMINVFFTRNVPEGIHISWPAVEDINRKTYNIFRREASSETFVKIATAKSDQFSYIDKNVTAETAYVYCMSVTEKDDREGERGASVSVKRILLAMPVRSN